MNRTIRSRKAWILVAVASLALGLIAPTALADDGPDDGAPDDGSHDTLVLPDRSDALVAHDAATAGVVSSGPTAKNVKNIDLRGRGERLAPDSTTDVWVLGNYAYTGTFNSPCGGHPSGEAGIWVWDVKNPNKTTPVAVIESEAGDRTNDVKVASMNSGDILVMSNESCGGGDGGFEIYDVDDPKNPVKLASETIDELNTITPLLFGPILDVGVHNLFLFTDGSNDYVAAVAGTAFDTFMIFDITDPTSPTLASSWGAEEAFDPGVGASGDFGRTLAAAIWLTTGFGASQNRFLHDMTITADGNQAYLANWDAGLILLDISDPTNPVYVSTALDLANGSLDGEVNSHAVWPSEDGMIVVESEEDFSAFSTVFNITSGDDSGEYEAFEFGFTTPIVTLPTQEMSGPTTYVGTACNSDGPVVSGSDIALVLRGGCRFDEKATNVIAAGYTGMVVFTANPGDAPFPGGGNSRSIPGVMVGNATGLLIAGVASMGDLVIGDPGETVAATAIPNAWSGLRIWDYSDPADPVLASTFNTTCAADPVDPICDPAGTYSVHNVIVETTGNKVKAYVSWYSDGMLVLDVSDPYNPVEVGRFLDASTNGGAPNDFWGVYKVPNDPFFYGSDRNGGLYTFKEQGSGSG